MNTQTPPSAETLAYEAARAANSPWARMNADPLGPAVLGSGSSRVTYGAARGPNGGIVLFHCDDNHGYLRGEEMTVEAFLNGLGLSLPTPAAEVK